MKKYIFLSVLMSGSLFASNNLCPENSEIDSYAHVCELFEGALQGMRESTLKDVLISNFETTQKNDAEYFFKGCLDPKMETILEKYENFDTKHGSEIEELYKKFENLKKFSEKYCEYQTALIATDTGFESFQAILENMSLYKKLKNDIAWKITEFYDMAKEMPTIPGNKQEPEFVTLKPKLKEEDPILLEMRLKQLRNLVNGTENFETPTTKN